MNFIKRIEEVDNLEIGNKALNLKRLTKQNINVPKSWVISSEVFMNILKEKGFNIENKGIYIDDILDVRIYFEKKFLREYYFQLYNEINYLKQNTKIKNFAIRSSGNIEDSQKNSLSGVFESYLNINKIANIIFSIQSCILNSIREEVIDYMKNNNMLYIQPCSIILQEFIYSYKSGVIFRDCEKKIINMNYGMNKYIVDGIGNIDEVILDLNDNIINKKQGKKSAIFPVFSKTNPRVNEVINIEAINQYTKVITSNLEENYIEVELQQDTKEVLTEEELEKLLSQCSKVSKILNCTNYDIEWTFDRDRLYILQCRPLTVDKVCIDYEIEKNKALGLVSGEYIGKVKKVNNLEEAKNFKQGEILVAKSLNKNVLMVLSKAGACMISAKSPLSHSSILARERGIPTIGAINIEDIENNKIYKINGKTGEYLKLDEFELSEISKNDDNKFSNDISEDVIDSFLKNFSSIKTDLFLLNDKK